MKLTCFAWIKCFSLLQTIQIGCEAYSVGKKGHMSIGKAVRALV
jgi:hypothetical protein